jgi:hypothetical protein
LRARRDAGSLSEQEIVGIVAGELGGQEPVILRGARTPSSGDAMPDTGSSRTEYRTDRLGAGATIRFHVCRKLALELLFQLEVAAQEKTAA